MILLGADEGQPRLRMVKIDPMLLTEMLRQGNRINAVVSEGIPTDAMCVGGSFDPNSSQIVIYFSHPLFDQVPYGGQIPEHRVILQKTVN